MIDEAHEPEGPGESGPPNADPSAEPSAAVSIGGYLAQQRKLRGVSIQELCARTKIPRRNIERLESGALDDQLDGFARGLVRTLAEALGLDADEAVMRLMSEPDADDERAARAERVARRYRVGATAVALVFAGLLSVVILGWWTDSEEVEPPPLVEREVTYRTDVVRALAREASEQPPPDRQPGTSPEPLPEVPVEPEPVVPPVPAS